MHHIFIHTVEDDLNAQFGFEIKAKLNSSAAMVGAATWQISAGGVLQTMSQFLKFLKPEVPESSKVSTRT